MLVDSYLSVRHVSHLSYSIAKCNSFRKYIISLTKSSCRTNEPCLCGRCSCQANGMSCRIICQCVAYWRYFLYLLEYASGERNIEYTILNQQFTVKNLFSKPGASSDCDETNLKSELKTCWQLIDFFAMSDCYAMQCDEQ